MVLCIIKRSVSEKQLLYKKFPSKPNDKNKNGYLKIHVTEWLINLKNKCTIDLSVKRAKITQKQHGKLSLK